MKKIQPVLFLFLMISGISNAQEYEEILRNVFYEAEFWMVEEAYPDALIEYQKLYSRGYENNANINYRMGVCYLNIPGEKEKSIPHLLEAVDNLTPRYKEGVFKETKAPYDALLYLGNAYRISAELDKAVENYNKYKELLEDKDSEEAHYTDKQIEACKNASKAMENPVYFIREHTGDIINTGTADYNPVVSFDESTMVYMTTLKFYDAINITKRQEDGSWGTPRQITAELEPEGKLFANSISRDGTELYLNMEDAFNSDIYVSKFEEERWSKAKLLNKEINTKYWESHASISGDGETLYLASNRKDGLGGIDIWESTKGPEGWGVPVNLGDKINTDLNEDHPFISEDGNILYFASQGHYNIGGYDVFYSEKQSDGSWGEPENIGYPLNTTDDDLFFVPVGNGEYGYQAIFSEENIGSRDIYRYQRFETEAEYLAAMALLEKDVTETEPVTEVTETTEAVVTPVVEKPAIMYVIRPVFFAFDKYDLSSEAKTTLEDLVKILEIYPELEIQAIGHTDHKGSDNYNLMLSRKRSAAVLRFISQRGINAKRIQSIGKGENQPVARNTMPDGSDSPEGRQLNRRVEIFVVKPVLPNITIEEVQVPDRLKK